MEIVRFMPLSLFETPMAIEMICNSFTETLALEIDNITPFIKYMLQLLLSCYAEFEERVGILYDSHVKSSAYDVVKAYVDGKLGKFVSGDVLANCPSVGRTSIFNAIKKLVKEGYIEKHGDRKSAYYVKAKLL